MKSGRRGGYIGHSIQASQPVWTTIRLSWFDKKISLKNSVASEVIDKANVQDNAVTDHFIISKLQTLYEIIIKKDKDYKIKTGYYEEDINPRFFTHQWSVNKVKEKLLYFIDKTGVCVDSSSSV